MNLAEIYNMSVSEIAAKSVADKKKICLLLAEDGTGKNRPLIWAIIQEFAPHDDVEFSAKLIEISVKQLTRLLTQK